MAFTLIIPVTLDGAGAVTTFSDQFSGKISQIRYVKNNFSNGSTLTFTMERTGEAVWSETNVNASATRAPRQATHGVDGAASLYAAAGTAVQDKIAVGQDRLKLVISAGGANALGTFYVLVE